MSKEFEKLEIEKDGVKLMVELSSTDSTILININGKYVGDIRPVLDTEGVPHAVLFTRGLSKPSDFNSDSYRID